MLRYLVVAAIVAVPAEFVQFNVWQQLSFAHDAQVIYSIVFGILIAAAAVVWAATEHNYEVCRTAHMKALLMAGKNRTDGGSRE